MSKSVKVKDLELFSRDLQLLSKEMPEEVEQITREATDKMESVVQVSYDGLTKDVTGNLDDGISSDVRRTTNNRVVGMVKSGAPHSHLIEFGSQMRQHKSGKETGRMPELAPMRKAFDSHEKNISQEVQDKIFNLMADRIEG